MTSTDLPVHDRFTAPIRRGAVPGSLADSGQLRGGVDAQSTLSCAGALRIRPLVRPGWDRSGIGYGPFDPADGMALSILVHHGHPASEAEDPWPPLHQYVAQWWRGTQVDPPLERLRTTWSLPTRERLARRVAAWRGHRNAPPTDGNFLVGWAESTAHTGGRAQGLVVRSSGADNAQLCLATPGRPVVVDDFPNLPLQVVAAQVPGGTLVLAATLAGAERLPELGRLRPLGFIAGPTGSWAVLQQAVLGQVGWSVDSVVPAVDIASTTTHFHPQQDPMTRTVRFGTDVLTAASPSEVPGLVVLESGDVVGVRIRDDGDGWLVRRQAGTVRLERWFDGAAVEVWEAAAASTPGTLQILDDGVELRVLAGDALVIGPVLHRANAGHATIAAATTAAGAALRAWPRSLPCPGSLATPAPPVPRADRTVIDERFGANGSAEDLDGMATSNGAMWTRTIGTQAFAVTPAGLVVPPVTGGRRGGKLAALRRGSGVRTAYTVPWQHPSASLTAEIVPPGSDRHQGQGSRAGVIFAEDDGNALLVNLWLDDDYDGTSISSFFRLNGHEEVFDAVWVNVGRRVTWGRPTELTVACDGDTYLVSVDGRPVLHRAITTVYPKAKPLTLQRVGIVANWEFGQDTGSVIRHFRALA